MDTRRAAARGADVRHGRRGVDWPLWLLVAWVVGAPAVVLAVRAASAEPFPPASVWLARALVLEPRSALTVVGDRTPSWETWETIAREAVCQAVPADGGGTLRLPVRVRLAVRTVYPSGAFGEELFHATTVDACP